MICPLWECSLSILFHRCRVYQADHSDLVHEVCSCRKRFSFLSSLIVQPLGFSCGFVPTSVFWPPSGVCSLPRVRRGKSSSWLGDSGQLGHLFVQAGGGIKQPHLVRVWIAMAMERNRKFQQTGMSLFWWKSLSVPAEASASGEVNCNDSPAACVPLNNGTWFPVKTMLPLEAFLAVESLTPIPSDVSVQPTAVFLLDLLS